jgi:hypothetical protein
MSEIATRSEFEKLIIEINKAKYTDPDDISLLAGVETCIEEDLDREKHRWYEISTTVYRCGDWLLGIRGVGKIYSEDMDTEDCDVKVEAFEMKKVPSVTYRKKKS